jgi:hypothetical protein
MSTIVVVTVNKLSSEDAADLVDVAGGNAAATTFHVAVPEQPTSSSVDAVVNDWELGVAAGRGVGTKTLADREMNPGEVARHDAQQVLEESLTALRATGAAADGEVTPNHPLDSIGDIVAHHSPDEVVVMIRHHHLSEATHTDLASKIKRRFNVDSLRVKAH